MHKSAHLITINREDRLKYLFYKPEINRQKFPLVLFLHGAGERGDNLKLVETHGLPMLYKKMNFPFILIAPQCPINQWWNDKSLVDTLIKLIDNFSDKKYIDSSRIYVTGLSMGGYGTYALITKRPELFAAALRICGKADLSLLSLVKSIPIWIFHGDKDPVIPVKHSIDAYELLKEFKESNARLTIYEDLGHDVWTETYNNDEVLDWLLDQKKA